MKAVIEWFFETLGRAFIMEVGPDVLDVETPEGMFGFAFMILVFIGVMAAVRNITGKD